MHVVLFLLNVYMQLGGTGKDTGMNWKGGPLLFRSLQFLFLTITKTGNRFDKINVNNWTVSITKKSVETSLFELLRYLYFNWELLWKFMENWHSSCYYQKNTFFMTLPWKSNWHILSSQAAGLQEFYLFNGATAFWQRRAVIFPSQKSGDGHCNH